MCPVDSVAYPPFQQLGPDVQAKKRQALMTSDNLTIFNVKWHNLSPLFARRSRHVDY